MVEARIVENLNLGNHEPGYCWKAGETPPKDSSPGEWLVKLSHAWFVIFRSAPTGVEYPIPIYFDPDDDGERAAKGMANKLVDNAWEVYRNDPRRRIKIEEVVG